MGTSERLLKQRLLGRVNNCLLATVNSMSIDHPPPANYCPSNPLLLADRSLGKPQVQACQG